MTHIVPGVTHYTSSILTIPNADLDDQGLYVCEATDTYFGQKEEKSIFIRVIGMLGEIFFFVTRLILPTLPEITFMPLGIT